MVQPVVPPTQSKQARTVLAAGLLGSSIEWYEFYIYGTAATLVFSKLFFPSFDPLVATMLSLSTFAVGFIARPVGSIIFGHFGDRIGRKSMLMITLILMGVATFCTGLLPTYDQVGIWAPIMLVALRVLQGFSLGGEYGGAILMTVEHAGPRRRGLFGAIVNTGVGWGLLMATLAYLALSQLPDEAFYTWGWRIPFLASIILVGVGLFIRLKIEESPEFEAVKKQGKVTERPVVEVLRRFPLRVVLMCMAYLSSGVTFYVATVFSLSYGTLVVGVSRTLMLTVVSISLCVSIPAMIFFGWFSDRYDKRKIFLYSTIAMMLVPYLWFSLVSTGNQLLMQLGFIALILCHAANYGTLPGFFSGVFPAYIRYSGLSLGYTLGAVLAGGFAPITATYLLDVTHSWVAIAIYMSAVGVLSIIGTLALKGRNVAEETLPIEPNDSKDSPVRA
jgi:MFS family permease